MHFHPSRILSGPLRPQSTKPTHPRSFNVVLGTPSQPRTLTTSAKRCLSPAKPEPSRRTTAHTGPGALELRESLQIYTRKQPRMEYNSFRGNAAPGGGNFAMQPSQMPSFYFDTTPGGTSQFHSGPSVPAPTASHGNMQTNQPVSIPTGPAAMTRLPPPNAPTEPRLVAAWGRDKFDLTPADYVKRVQCYKRLQRIWADAAVQASHPDGLRWDQTNTVLVDDSLEKARSEPFNLLRIPEFFGDADEATDVLPQVHDYINALCYQADISQYMRLHPFGLRDDYTLERPPSA
ncbi:hypothetical protein EV126DRAFT_478649 [Verticillium dahliae]|nr:hypothetical protein EV126DRAFT_478649 [Verticillium dahliae]